MGCEGMQTVAVDTTLSSFAANGEEHCWQPEHKKEMRIARVCLMLVGVTKGGWAGRLCYQVEKWVSGSREDSSPAGRWGRKKSL